MKRHVLTQSDRHALDNLMGVALLDADVRHRLVYERDNSLFAAFSISGETQNWLRGIQATSLVELARAILDDSQNAQAA